jgi:hypothetical protein
MRVVYRADIEIEVPNTRQKHMAVFEASKQWPDIEEQIRGLASAVTVTSIRVEGAERSASKED